jgi:hypothetical protein
MDGLPSSTAVRAAIRESTSAVLPRSAVRQDRERVRPAASRPRQLTAAPSPAINIAASRLRSNTLPKLKQEAQRLRWSQAGRAI